MCAFARGPLLLALLWVATTAHGSDPLPRYTEEREAAALHFVRKHCPELVPLLDELKKAARPTYERQIRETFQITELLADLQDDPKRHELELNLWKIENKAMVLVAKLTTARDDERPKIEEQLQSLAKEIVELDLQSLDYRGEVLQTELNATKDEAAKIRENLDRSVKERFETLIEKARKKKP